MKTGPKPKCDCGVCPTCYFRNAKRKARLNNRKPLKRTPLKRSTKPIARKTAVKPKRSKPRRVSVLRDRGYLDWLKERKCVACQSEFRHSEIPLARLLREIDPAHTINNGRGSKGPDSSCISLCRNHHREQHSMGWPDFENHYGFDRQREAEAHYLAYTISRESEA